MSELRWHPFLEEWVVTATHRQDRTYKPPKEHCPLCPTNPGAFPTEVPAETYEIAVFENRFPSFKTPPPEPDVQGDDLFGVAPAAGVCEVVLYSQDHDGTISRMSVDHIARLVDVWTDRYAELGALDEVNYVFIFENRGEAVGVTLHHPHGQIYGFPFIPPIPQRELDAARRHMERTGRCLSCDVAAREAKGPRLIRGGDRFVTYVPFFARYPFEAHIAPVAHRGSLLSFDEAERRELAVAIKDLTVRYDRLFGFDLPYMMVMHQAPTDGEERPEAHFHVEFYPLHRTAERLKHLAGCESGAGTFIADMAPEEQAARLRASGEGGERP